MTGSSVLLAPLLIALGGVFVSVIAGQKTLNRRFTIKMLSCPVTAHAFASATYRIGIPMDELREERKKQG
ncbi:MAG: hypothetical protein PVI81_05540 [Anaerolineales bacterium]